MYDDERGERRNDDEDDADVPREEEADADDDDECDEYYDGDERRGHDRGGQPKRAPRGVAVAAAEMISDADRDDHGKHRVDRAGPHDGRRGDGARRRDRVRAELRHEKRRRLADDDAEDERPDERRGLP